MAIKINLANINIGKRNKRIRKREREQQRYEEELRKIKEREKRRKAREEAEKDYYGEVKSKRETIPKDKREIVFDKFNNKCAGDSGCWCCPLHSF